jgi:hypothetical protein
MNNYIPIFEKFINNQNLFYFDRINEDNTQEGERQSLLLGTLRTDPDAVAEYANSKFSQPNPFYSPNKIPNGKWMPSDFGKSIIASLESLTVGNKKTTNHQGTGFGINLSAHPNYKPIEDGPNAIKEAFEQMDIFIEKELVDPFDKWIKKYKYVFNQNMADALFSFAYSTGPGRLESLTKGTSEPRGPRHEGILPAGMKLYVKGWSGLIKRREVESKLYIGQLTSKEQFINITGNTWYDYVSKKSNNVLKIINVENKAKVPEIPSTATPLNVQQPTSGQ